MAGLRRRMRSASAGASRKTADRRAKSFYMMVTFVSFFVLMMLIEVLFVENNPSQDDSFLSRWGLTNAREPMGPSHLARELALVLSDAQTESPEELLPAVTSSNNASALLVDHWQPVRHTKDKFFVFSAYYDDRRSRHVRVIAAARTRTADKVTCKFWFDDGRRPVTVYATNRLIRENWNLKYSAYFLLCPLTSAVTRVPDQVSIQRQSDAQTAPANRLTVHHQRAKYPKPSGMAVCVKPLHYDYDKVMGLVEFLELNRLLGVTHVVLYNHTVSARVGCTVRHYERENLVTVLPWQLDLVSQKEIRTEGLFAALNDCLYRTMYRFKYVLMIDLDEYVVPYQHDSLEALLRHLQDKHLDRAGAYSFQNAFFYLQWPDDRNASDLGLSLTTLKKTRRKVKFHAHKQRSKCIILPERVVEMGNHFVWEFVAGRSMRNIAPEVAFLHHYRVCEFGGNDCVNTSSMVDRRVYVWRSPLLQAVAARLRHMQSLCQFPANVTGMPS